MGETGTVQIKHVPAQERYEAYVAAEDGTDVQVGYLDYVTEIEQVVLTHTVVFERFSGHGYAGQLVKAVLDDIRPSGNKVVPVCSYVESYVGKHPEYADMAVSVPR
ncbi:N-acetyltransferase [Gordonia amarae]|uniref:N-acetyltransferase domain-containing protein n=2 Tax=Gordonia amarae TaxID=36821 RepID=G7GU87_9ACTN|nr:GNAT family N-acetyltransferase [Gordonia amarae]MCS3877493.1 putative GNAT family acetyltransferase [Gordonia amarae]QHN16228.1 N-acetyltransferase [Gordonia amarae]QHN20797.1 N-acetyltransferase [Gordonia amarae]QHN29648.1 N-acetyltransferase [Gordonia amarae]QHN38424.1 N-acetyltransferase [Gordonia amarae]